MILKNPFMKNNKSKGKVRKRLVHKFRHPREEKKKKLKKIEVKK